MDFTIKRIYTEVLKYKMNIMFETGEYFIGMGGIKIWLVVFRKDGSINRLQLYDEQTPIKYF
jgi:hypothetical protein